MFFRLPSFPLVILAGLLFVPTFTAANETDQDVPVSAVGGTVHADLFTGTATTSIPIAVPPGRGGVHPNLALVYNSANGNGWVGLGWKLEKSVIERQTRFGLNYAGDTYVFRLAGINVDLVNVGSNQYRAKIEGGFTRVQKLTASDGKPSFLATDKTGQKFYFGRTAATRVAHPSDANKIFRWCLERVEDPDGNYMTISYTGDQGQSYLSRIDYTGHGSTRPTNSVTFHLETRPDAVPMYTSHFLMKTAKRLKTIEIRANNQLVRAYKLTYTSSGNTTRSLLSRIQQIGHDSTVDTHGTVTGGSFSPSITLRWDDGRSGIVGTNASKRGGYQQWSAENWAPATRTHGLADVTGDGKVDILSFQRGGLYVWESNGTGIVGTNASKRGGYQQWSAENWAPATRTHGLADVTGDGKVDVLSFQRGGLYVWESSGTGIVGTNASKRGGYQQWSAENWAPATRTHGLADVTGDGKVDVLSFQQGGLYVWESSGTGIVGTNASKRGGYQQWSAENWAPATRTHGLADVTGDGKVDILSFQQGGLYVWESSGSGIVGTNASKRGGYQQWSAENWAPATRTHGLADVTGDGKVDILSFQQGGLYVWESSGSGIVGTNASKRGGYQQWSAENWAPATRTHGLADVTGDGKVDILSFQQGGLYVWESNGTGIVGTNASKRGGYQQWSAENWAPATRTHGLADVTGDGKVDILSFQQGGLYVWPVSSGGRGLLTAVSNGLGATTTLTYKPSTQYTNTQLPYPTQTVATITTNDGNGNVAATTYTYAGGYHHIGEREFRGFHYAKVTGPAGPSGEKTITETWFHQGNDLAVGTNNPAVAHGYLKGAPYRVKVTDARGNRYSETTTTYTADANGQAPFFTPPASVVIKTCDGNATCRTTRTDYTYDAYGNVTQERQYGDTATTTDDRTVVRTFAANTTKWIVTLPTRETIRAGLGTTGTELARTDFYYDGTTSCAAASVTQTPAKGHLTRSVRWLSGATTHPETRMAYNSQGNLICTRDANGHTTTTGYDPSGTFVTTVTNAQGHVTATAYYGVNGVATTRGVYGQVKSVTDANGAVVTTEYDALGRRTKVTQPDGFWTTTSYVNFGTVGSQHVRTASQLGLSTWTYFDGLGRTIKQQSTGAENRQIITETQYDARGAVTRTSVPYKAGTSTKQWTTSAYDPLGRVLQTTHPDGTRTRACYDDGVTVTLDAKGHKKRTTRDAYGRVVKVEEYTSVSITCTTARGTPYATTTYAHDRLGNLTTVTDALGNRTTLTYDTLSRKTSMRDPDLGTWTYAYDRHGNLIRQTDAKRQQTHFRYDALHRRTQKDYGTQKTAGAGDVRYTYDGSAYNRQGRLQQVVDTSGTTRFYYDRAGRVVQTDKIVDDLTYTTGQRYDGLGRVTHLSYPASRAAGQAAGIATRVGTATNFGVNVVGAAKMAEHQGTLYLVGSTTAATGTTAALYRLNPTTGVATQVGTATNFGVNEGGVGLASHNGKLYMVGNVADALYTLNPTTGVATRVGTATKFGVNEGAPRAFTSHQGTLYMAGSDTHALYTLNPTTGVAARVGTATKFGVKETHVRALASYQGALYMVGGVTRRLYRVDPTTGVATPVSRTRGFGQRLNPNGLAAYQGRLYLTINTHQSSAVNALYTLSPPPPPPRAGAALKEPGTATRVGRATWFGRNERWPLGLVSHQGTLYMAGRSNNALYTVNPTTGAATRVGTATKFGVNERYTAGLASHQGKLYMVGASTDALYTLNPTTGVATRVGTATKFGVNEGDPASLVSHQGKLYMVSWHTAALYTLNPTTGVATRVGTATKFGVNEGNPLGLTSYNGKLYMVSNRNRALYTLNPTTGVAARVATASFGAAGQPSGLAEHQGRLYVVGWRTTGALYTLSPPLPPHTVTYTYTGPQLQSVQEGSTTYARYSSFNALGQPSTLTLGNGTTTNYTYDSRNYRLKTLRTVKGSTVLQNLGYTFDPAGNVTNLTDARHGTQTFAYDGLDRLTGTTGEDGSIAYTYNQIGNMLSNSALDGQPTGTAMQVGTATWFGVTNRWVFGLTSHNGKLYMTGYRPHALFTLNPTTGVASRVGTATNFGVDERNPTGVASHGGKLYMLGARTDALYTVDPTTGVATRVGTATKFGVNEGVPHGLASHHGTLYMTGADTDALYTLNPTTGVATRVGTATRFGVNEGFQTGLAAHNGKLYMTGWHTGAMYTVNPTTGVATRVGSATNFGVNERWPVDLASHQGTLYMLGDATGALFRLNPTSPGTYTYNPSGRTSTRPHAVTRAGTKTYSYDANGNMLLGDGRIMTYDAENRLSTVRKNGGTTTFVYDGDGGRVKKTVTSGSTTTTTTYIGKLYVCEGTSCSRLIYAGNQRIALVPMPPSGRPASPSYFHPDHLGSTSVLTNAQGVAEEHNSYRPYGQLHTHTGTADVAYKYTGQERDPSTGLYFYHARYYDPVLGRFLSPDTLVQSLGDPQSLNRYAYARNNPVLYTDPTGHFSATRAWEHYTPSPPRASL